MASMLRAALVTARRTARRPALTSGSQSAPAVALFSTKPEVKTSFTEILDRATNIFFLTELLRGFWLSFEVSMKPKVGHT